MIIKATLGTLILILIVVIASSYYINKEGFDNITNTSMTGSNTAATPKSSNTVATPSSSLSIPASPAVTGATKDLLNPSSVASTAASVEANTPASPIALIVPAPTAIASLKSALGATGASGATPLGAIPLGAIGATTSSDASPSGATPLGASPLDALNSTIPKRTDVVPEVSVSKCGFDAMALQQRADLLKDIQSVVKNEILANRSVTPVTNSDVKPTAKTASVSQGKEYENSCYKDTDYKSSKNSDDSCPQMPDMAQYIKKDAIPCWGCSVDY